MRVDSIASEAVPTARSIPVALHAAGLLDSATSSLADHPRNTLRTKSPIEKNPALDGDKETRSSRT
jgi:hypothetical protein